MQFLSASHVTSVKAHSHFKSGSSAQHNKTNTTKLKPERPSIPESSALCILHLQIPGRRSNAAVLIVENAEVAMES